MGRGTLGIMREQADFGALPVLIVGGRAHGVQVLRQALHMAGVKTTRVVPLPAPAVQLLRSNSFQAVFCDPVEFEAGAFIGAARRTAGVLNPMIPIFLLCLRPRRRDIEAVRDLGFTDVIARPLSAATIKRKLRSALAHPRAFIATPDFFGPDRRTHDRTWKGADRRKRQPRKIKVAAPQNVETAPE